MARVCVVCMARVYVHLCICTLRRHSYFTERPSSSWCPALLDAIMVVMDTAVADLLSHVMGHYNGGNLGPEMLIELLSLCFWSMRPTEPSRGGLQPSLWARARRAVQRQWALVLQRLGTWRRDLATKCYWQLVEMKPEWAAHYAEALQFVRWRVRCRTSSRAVTAWLFNQLELAPKLEPAAALRQAQAMVFTVEQLRLPMAQRDLPQVIVSVVDQPMTMVQAWYDHAIQEFHNAAAAKAKGFGGRSSPRQVNDHGAAQRQLVFMELAIACVLQLKERLHTSTRYIPVLATYYCLLLATACCLPLTTCHTPLYRSASCTRRCLCSSTRCAPCAGPQSLSRPRCSACLASPAALLAPLLTPTLTPTLTTHHSPLTFTLTLPTHHSTLTLTLALTLHPDQVRAPAAARLLPRPTPLLDSRPEGGSPRR